MTQKAIKKLQALRAATVRYTPRVEQELSKIGKASDAAVTESAAKYYVAIKKLAKK